MRISDWSSVVFSSDLWAVAWAALFNFIAFLVFGLHVANTIGAGIINPDIVDAQVVFSALTGAIVWNVITWVLGIPSSSSHALIGGRSEERRVGKGGVSTCRSRWWASH